jgi:putative hydrolase of the HAD superfamily
MTRFAGVRAVTFDCWGTLIYETDPTATRRLRETMIADHWGISIEEASSLHVDAWMAHVAAWERHEQFGAPGVLAFMAAKLGTVAPPEDFVDRYESIALSTSAVSAVAGAGSALASLKDAGLSTALVCDTGLTPGRIVRRLLESTGLIGYLDALAFSDEVGVPKPERAMFEAALSAIGGGPAVHVGDLRRTDVAGARNAGLGAIRFRGVYDDPSDHPDGDEVIDDLRRIPELVGVSA